MSYEGLPPELRAQVFGRDAYRCRWCGSTNQGVDIHHIAYRRGVSFDVLENLVTLCRRCHEFVHGTPRPSGKRISKQVAQDVLLWVLEHPGEVGSSRHSRLLRDFALADLCEHGQEMVTCPYCRP